MDERVRWSTGGAKNVKIQIEPHKHFVTRNFFTFCVALANDEISRGKRF